MRKLMIGLAIVSFCSSPLTAQEVISNSEGDTATVEGEAPAASNQGESASDISPQAGLTTTASSNAINIETTATGYRVLRGDQIVEAFDGSEGVTGVVEAGSGYVFFTPTGRPKLRCMEDTSGHFTDCKMDEVTE